jgi:hypothetical protein
MEEKSIYGGIKEITSIRTNMMDSPCFKFDGTVNSLLKKGYRILHLGQETYRGPSSEGDPLYHNTVVILGSEVVSEPVSVSITVNAPSTPLPEQENTEDPGYVEA